MQRRVIRQVSMGGWYELETGPLQLRACLGGGQSFRWKHDEGSDEWTGIFKKTVLKLRQNTKGISYKVLGSLDYNKKSDTKSAPADDGEKAFFESLLKEYFNLDYDLEKLYEQWSNSDPLFALAAKNFYGVRMLAQDPVENLFSFICSQNNNISRISSMIEKLCDKYGQKICECEDIEYYAFPTVDNLSHEKVEQELRELKFGYRAKFIQQSAEKIKEWGGKEWIDSLKSMPYKNAKLELVKLPGIGPKVADCISLMSLGHMEAVPVDTHVFQIAANNYLKHLKNSKSVTDKIYNEIGDHFRNMYGPLAGWAHTILFCADLKKFTDIGDKRISDSKSTIPKRKKLKK